MMYSRLACRLFLMLCIIIAFILLVPDGLREDEAPSGFMAGTCVDCNIILVSVDTLRADGLGAYGNARQVSPNIDRMASGGVLYQRAYSPSSMTAPSHMSFMTGLYPSEHGVCNLERREVWCRHELEDTVVTLADVLRQEGYRTVAFTGGGNVDGRMGFDRGFDSYTHYDFADPVINQVLGAEGEVDFRDVVGNLSGGKFFLFLHTYKTHDPYFPGEETRSSVCGGYDRTVIDSWSRLMGEKTISRLMDENPDFSFANGSHIIRKAVFKSNLSEYDVGYLRCLYDAEIREMDEKLGLILDSLEDAGLEGKTLIIVTSDHGEEFREHGGLLHHQLYNEIIHVPLIVKNPGLTGGANVPGYFSVVSLPASILDAVGVDVPAQFRDTGGEPVISEEYAFRRRAIIYGGYKLMAYPDERMLFSMESDYREQRDMISEDAGTAGRLESIMNDILPEYAGEVAGGGEKLGEGKKRELRHLGYVD
ncbi:MAG: sulfatase [Candidatus Altiarchaeota archaeon]